MAFRFVHAADLHLDTPFNGLAATDELVAAALRDASLDAFDNLVQLAVEREAAFVLLAGDVYDGESRGVRAQLRFLKGLERLSATNIKVFVVHGNHDPVGGWSAIRQWPSGITIFGHSEVECHPVQSDGQTLANIYGISYARQDVSENLALRFHRRNGDGLHIGLLHCNLGNNPEHASYSPCQVEDLARAGMDYWALGHIHHRPAEHLRNPWIVYPGNLQGRSPKPGECGPKGAVVVEADPAGVRSVEFVALDEARFVQSKLDIGRVADLAALRQALLDTADQLREEHGERLLLVRTVLSGSGEVHSDLTGKRIDELLMELRAECGQRRPVLYWESIVDRTEPELDVSGIRNRGDFLAEVLRYSESLGTEEQHMQAFLAQHLADLNCLPSRLREELELLDDRDVLRRACTVALEMLRQEAAE
jgi:DNA repair exonuclease SbcCD nuclease subunit